MLADYQQNKFQPGIEYTDVKTKTKYSIKNIRLSPFQNTFFANVIKGDKSDWIDSIDIKELILDAFNTYSSLKGDPIHED